MVEAHHTPVMVQEVLTALQIRPGGSYIDCTLGEGGHSLALVAAAKVRLLGIDLDTQALGVATSRLDAFIDRVVLVERNFAELDVIARDQGFSAVQGVLFDLGLSSLQVGTRDRGFSFRQESRLDMRFGATQRITAHQVVNEYSEESLADIIYRLGEEPRARRIARAIVKGRPMDTTTQLAETVSRTAGRSRTRRIHPATRTFQAVRMEVNEELSNLRRGLEGAIDVLAKGGRVAVIAYHSLEDRLVKGLLRREASQCICPPSTPECVCGHIARVKLVNRKVIKPMSEEIQANPRSRSARMRVAERI